MAVHLNREIDNLKMKLLALGTKVEALVRNATLSIEDLDQELAQKVITSDVDVDDSEVEIEEECLKILALYQPVAIDLRFIVAILKINNDLERIGDLAVNIAERTTYLANHPTIDVSLELFEMGRNAQVMLKKSLDALVNKDIRLAQEVFENDDIVDNMNRNVYVKIQQSILKHPDQISSLIHLLSASRHLERIADHTTNIAEDVIYMIEGQIVRHQTETYR